VVSDPGEQKLHSNNNYIRVPRFHLARRAIVFNRLHWRWRAGLRNKRVAANPEAPQTASDLAQAHKKARSSAADGLWN
jgi:hypothetical protein